MEGRDSPEGAESERGTIERRQLHTGRVVDLSIDTVRFPDGSVGQLEMIRHSGASAVLPLIGDTADTDPEILLIRQYRYATGGFIIEVPAGRPEVAGEDWALCARRELQEETGYRAQSIVPLNYIYTTPGFTDERIYLFLAYGLVPGERHLDQDEFIELLTMPISEAISLIRAGEIVDAKTICTLYAANDWLQEERATTPATLDS